MKLTRPLERGSLGREERVAAVTPTASKLIASASTSRGPKPIAAGWPLALPLDVTAALRAPTPSVQAGSGKNGEVSSPL